MIKQKQTKKKRKKKEKENKRNSQLHERESISARSVRIIS